MVRVVVAGGTGFVSQDVLAEVVASGKHEVVVFTRTGTPEKHMQGVTYTRVDYDDENDLVYHLREVHSVLCFISNTKAQIALIDACIKAGVKRYAPNEWASRSYTGLFTYKDKDDVFDYLKAVNKERKVIEFCLFQPGLFMNYLSSPTPSFKFSPTFTNHWDIENRRAIVPAEGDYEVCLTTAQDLGKVVAEALDYEGEWPEIGGITGTSTSNDDIIRRAEKIRGGPFTLSKVPLAQLESGKLGDSWIPLLPMPPQGLPTDLQTFSEYVIAHIVYGGVKGAWKVSDEWNQLLPHLKLTSLDEFLEKYWKDKP